MNMVFIMMLTILSFEIIFYLNDVDENCIRMFMLKIMVRIY